MLFAANNNNAFFLINHWLQSSQSLKTHYTQLQQLPTALKAAAVPDNSCPQP